MNSTSPTIDHDRRPRPSRRSRISDCGAFCAEDTLGSITSPRIRRQTAFQTTARLPPPRAALPDLTDRRVLDVADCRLRGARRHVPIGLHLEHPERRAQKLRLMRSMGLDRHTKWCRVAEVSRHDLELRLTVHDGK